MTLLKGCVYLYSKCMHDILFAVFIGAFPDILQYYLRCSSGQINPFQQVRQSCVVIVALLCQ